MISARIGGGACLKFLSSGWRIFAFEPDGSNRAVLEKKIKGHKNYDRIHVDHRAVGNKAQNNVPFFRSEESSGISGLSAFHPSHEQSGCVDVITLTEFIEENDEIDKIDFLKIDTEGHDLFVLQGFPWKKIKPSIILCEFEDNKTDPLGYKFNDIAAYLIDKGYTIYVSEWHPIVRYGVAHSWNTLKRYPCHLQDKNAWGNLLAFNPSTGEAVLKKAAIEALIHSNPSMQIKRHDDLEVAIDNGPNINKNHLLSAYDKIKEKFEGLWGGILTSIILIIITFTDIPGSKIIGVLSLLPIFWSWRKRAIRRIVNQPRVK